MLNEGQYGSRPKRNAIDPVMLEELQFEISRMSRQMLIQTNYNAASCYDRIIPNLAMVVSQKFGVHPKVTQLMPNPAVGKKVSRSNRLGIVNNKFQSFN